jgi:lysosomal alpha-mannosidase
MSALRSAAFILANDVFHPHCSPSRLPTADIFRPNGTSPFDVATGAVSVTVTSSGPVVWEVQQVFADWASQTVRLFAGSSTIEFEYDLGAVPFADGQGKEIVSRFTASAIASNGTWISDSNGRDSQVRVRAHRRSFVYNASYEPVAGEFVPVNLFTSLADAKTQLSIAVDRSQAGASLADGSLELMIQRRILHDDSRGVGEPLNETGLDGRGLRLRGVHRVEISPAAAGAERMRAMSGHALFGAHLQFAQNTAASPAAWVAANRASYSALRAPLPANLHVVTLHAQSPTMALLRIAHMRAVGEGALAAPASVDLATMFAAFTIQSAEEMILTGTIPLTSAPVSTFQTRDGRNVTLPVVYPAPAGPALTITLSAMQIRTFRCQIAY